ncbi:hypothetical protein [Prauserella sp. PE36]|uniref:hypothetical protein n=1 Tax=Prauserella sp. PE36 TaxID=1504709 RepID=UPI0013147707|nr:hypothetical protein [Prauserella sp. PE36]
MDDGMERGLVRMGLLRIPPEPASAQGVLAHFGVVVAEVISGSGMITSRPT